MLKAAASRGSTTFCMMAAPDRLTQPTAAGVLEKTPLERYVAPDKPSLVGMSRGRLGEALAAVGVPERQRRMRVQQLWHWLYLRGATQFDEMTSVSKELR